MMAPAHFPVLKPQQESAQSVSVVQLPVMNCVPTAVERTGRDTLGLLGWGGMAGLGMGGSMNESLLFKRSKAVMTVVLVVVNILKKGR